MVRGQLCFLHGAGVRTCQDQLYRLDAMVDLAQSMHVAGEGCTPTSSFGWTIETGNATATNAHEQVTDIHSQLIALLFRPSHSLHTSIISGLRAF